MEIVHITRLDRARSSEAAGGIERDPGGGISRRRRREQAAARGEGCSVESACASEFALVASAAAGERLALGAYAVHAVLAAARRSVQPQYALLREALATVMHAAGQARRIGVNLNQAVAALNSGSRRHSCAGMPRRRLEPFGILMTWPTKCVGAFRDAVVAR